MLGKCCATEPDFRLCGAGVVCLLSYSFLGTVAVSDDWLLAPAAYDSEVGVYFWFRAAGLTQVSPVPGPMLLTQAENKASGNHRKRPSIFHEKARFSWQ